MAKVNIHLKTFVTGSFGSRVKNVGARYSKTANTVRDIAKELRRDPLTRGVANVVEIAAARIETVGHYVSDSTLDALMADAKQFSRRRPWIIAIAGVTLGPNASRLSEAGAASRNNGIADRTEMNRTSNYMPEQVETLIARPAIRLVSDIDICVAHSDWILLSNAQSVDMDTPAVAR